MLQHGKRHHGFVSLAALPEKEQNKEGCRANKEANDHRAVPGKLVATVLQSQEETNSSGADEHEARKIEGLDSRTKDLSRRRLGFRFGDAEEEEQDAHDATDGEVDVET
jgi:hypothetical protein